MNDAEFYKNLLLQALNGCRCSIRLGEDVELKLDNGKFVDVKRKLILKEKTWYRTRNNGVRFILTIFPCWYKSENQVWVLNPDSGLGSNRYSNGLFTLNSENQEDLIRECTAEEVKEIEDKLREQK